MFRKQLSLNELALRNIGVSVPRGIPPHRWLRVLGEEAERGFHKELCGLIDDAYCGSAVA